MKNVAKILIEINFELKEIKDKRKKKYKGMVRRERDDMMGLLEGGEEEGEREKENNDKSFNNSQEERNIKNNINNNSDKDK